MSEAIAVPARPLPVARWLRLVPGVALLFAIGYAGKLTEGLLRDYGKSHHLALPNIEYVLWAIVFGLLVSNVLRVPDVVKLGRVSLGLVAIELVVAIAIMTVIGRWFRLKPKLISLLAIGSSICGVSAIIAGQGAIEADDDDATFAIAAILALGAFGLFAYPAIGHLLHMSDRAFGVWAGLAVDNTAEAAAAGAIFSDVAGKVAVLTKSTRNAMIGFVVLAYAIYWASRGQAKTVQGKAAFLWQKFPKFVLGFLFVSLLATLQVFDKVQIASLANLSRWAFLLTFAGVGLKTDFREIKRQGVRPFVVGALAELTITAITLVLVLAAAAIFSL